MSLTQIASGITGAPAVAPKQGRYEENVATMTEFYAALETLTSSQPVGDFLNQTAGGRIAKNTGVASIRGVRSGGDEIRNVRLDFVDDRLVLVGGTSGAAAQGREVGTQDIDLVATDPSQLREMLTKVLTKFSDYYVSRDGVPDTGRPTTAGRSGLQPNQL